MKRSVLVGAAVFGVAVCVRRAARGCGGFDFERMIERMPENAPPKWMFRNISAIRANSERILELLEAKHLPATGERACRRPRSGRERREETTDVLD
jgi:hypothetical protein